MRSSQRKSCDAVVERRRGPACRRMASGAVRRGKRGSGRGVHRIIRLLPGGQVTLRVSAIGRRDRQIIVVIRVAQIAGYARVTAGQRESRGAVVKRCRCPTGGRVTSRAVRSRKSSAGRRMHRICGCLPGG